MMGCLQLVLQVFCVQSEVELLSVEIGHVSCFHARENGWSAKV
jgi:hypothetical protein